MNIGYVYGFNSWPPKGGGAIHVYNLVRNFAAMGHEIHAFEPEQGADCVTYPVSASGIADFMRNVDVVYVRIDGSFLSQSVLKRECMKHVGGKPLVWEVNAPTDETLAYMRHVRQVNRIQTQSIPRQIKRALTDWSLRSDVRKEDRIRRSCATRVHAAISVSEALSGYVHGDLGIERCEVIPNGSDPELFSGIEPNERLDDYSDYYKVIYAGASYWFWQGVDVIDELASLAEKRKDKVLFILLDNSARKQPKQRRPNLLVFDCVNYFDVGSYLAAADACLCLYHDFAWSRYGFYLSPLKLYDYMASGKPVIASRLGQISEVIDDGKDGLLVNNDPQEIYDRILFCRNSRADAAKLAQAAQRKIVETYNWKRAAQSTVDVFKALIE